MPDDEVVVEAPETEVSDESVNVTIVNVETEPEPEAPATVPQHDHGPCAEAARANQRIDELEAAVTALATVEVVEDEETVPEAPAETVIEDEQSEETPAAGGSGGTGHMAPGWF